MGKIYNIPANYHFLQSLLSWLHDNFVTEEFSNLTILLPNRRSVREFLYLIKNQNREQKTFILPKVKAIGDLGFEDFFDNFEFESEISALELKNIIANLAELKVAAPLKYLLYLAQKIRDFDKIHQIFGKNVSFEQYFSIAINVAELFDEAEKNDADLQKLVEIDDAQMAQHQQFILQFLHDSYFEIKNSLIKENLLSRTFYQDFIIQNFCDFAAKNPLKNPFIIAGSTGSISYGKKLISAISRQKQGYVILYGLDKNIVKIEEKQHAQFVLSELIKTLKIEKKAIEDIKKEQFLLCDEKRKELVSLAMLPYFAAEKWQEVDKNYFSESLKNIEVIECKDEFVEAQIITLALQKGYFENKNCALISNDSKLVDLVKLQLQKAGLSFNDATSQAILQKPLVGFILTILHLFEEFDSHIFLALLKHDLCFAAQEKWQIDLQKLETEIFRKPLAINNLQDLGLEISKVFGKENIFLIVIKILQESQNSLKTQTKLSEIFAIVIKTVEALLEKNFNTILADENNDEFLEFIMNLQIIDVDLQNVNLANFFHLLFSLVSDFFAHDEDCKINILSTIEARLLNYDLTIISSLNEGSLPQIKSENWLGKKIRADLGVDNLGVEIGINAYDFCNHFCNKEVILTRAITNNNVENIASRFLLKLQALAKKAGIKIANGDYYKEILRTLSKTQSEILPKIARANPQINKEVFPKSFAVTDFSKLMYDPYSIYAKNILKLKPLKEIDCELGRAEFGSFVHEVLEKFIAQNDKEEFWNEAKIIFRKYFTKQESEIIWWSKFENVFTEFLQKNEEFCGFENKVEIAVRTEVFVEDIGFVEIRGRVDRLVIDQNGFATLFDYKTGSTLPTKKDINSGLEPQLAISGFLIENCEQTADLRDKINGLKYWKLSFNNQGKIQAMFDDLPQVRLAINEASDGLKKLLQFFAKGNGFISYHNPKKYKKGDYHHLARIDEWN